MRHLRTTSSGFTLVEVAILVTVIGLLSAALLIGRDLIEAAEMRSLHGQVTKFVTASKAFEAKYSCMPGDCPVATKYFPRTPQGCYWPDQAGSPTPVNYPQQRTACDGNGNGQLDYPGIGPSSLSTNFEGFGAWQHLANADLLSGTFSGSAQPPHLYKAGHNCPAVGSDNYCWVWMYSHDSLYEDSNIAIGTMSNVISIWPTSPDYLIHLGKPGWQYYSPMDMQRFDSKFDDGLPDTGRVIVQVGYYNPGCSTETTPRQYAAAGTSRDCGITFRLDQ